MLNMLTNPLDITEEQRIAKAVTKIINEERYRWLVGVITTGFKEVVDDPNVCATAMTNGRDEWYNRDFIRDLSDAELRYLILHENSHKWMRDMEVWVHLSKLCATTANMAMDHVNNLLLNEENAHDGFAVMPTDEDGNPTGLADPRFTGMDAEEVFWILYQQEDGEGGGEGEPEGEGGTPKGGGMDDHDWDGHKELSDEEKEELRKDIEEAIRQGEIAAGKTGSGGMSGRVKELLKPRVDWLAVMREYLTMTCAGSDYSTWNKPNRKYISSGWYLPSGVSERAECVVFAPDASGSCFTDSYLTRFFTEAMRIIEVLKIKKVIILYWDTEVITPIEIYEDTTIANIIATTKPEGGGGTNPTCIPKYMKEHHINPNAVVVLTDGEIWNGQWGTWDWPVLWCIAKPHGGRAETAPVGQTVVVDL
jgi:predicted metal-dependent peptidase